MGYSAEYIDRRRLFDRLCSALLRIIQESFRIVHDYFAEYIGRIRLSSRLYRALLRDSLADYIGLFCESDDLLAGVFVF